MNKAMIKGDNGKFEDRSIEVLHDAVVSHYTKIGLYDHATPLKQQVYALGEAGELSVDGVLKNDLEEIKDGIGDVMICLINWAHLFKVDFIESFSLHDGGEPYQKYSAEMLCIFLHSDISVMGEEDNLEIVISILVAIGVLYDLTLSECLGHAYDVVTKRKIKFLNGVAIKDADWHKFPELAES